MKEKGQKYVNGVCPYCNSPLKTLKDESVKCENCGATVTYAEIKNQHAVIQQTNDGKKKFNFKNLIKKWWFWTAIAIVVLLVIGICVPNSGKSTKEEDPNLYGKYAGTIEVDDYTIYVERYDTDISSIKEEDTGIYHVADNKYLIIKVRLGNKSSELKYFSTNNFKILYNGQTYKNLELESILYGESHHYDGLGWGWSVEPQKWKTVFLVFDVPESIDTAKYILSFKPSDTEIKIKLY